MTCKQCGKDFASDLMVCPHCGTTAPAQVSLGSLSAAQKKDAKPAQKKKPDPDRGLRITLIIVSIVAVLGILGGIVAMFWPSIAPWFFKLIGRGFVEKSAQIDDKFSVEEQEEMDVNTELPSAKEGILNIALLGLDERGETGETVDSAGKGKSFHSDAIIILTIDRRDPDNPRIKMSSIARDTLVYVEGYNSKANKTKLTHAFQYGYNKAKNADASNRNAIKKKYKGNELTEQLAQLEANYKREGAKTAIKTINYNFHMNITEYVYVNFVEFMDIIDYVGGVTINVEQREINELNKHVRAMEKECGRDLNTVKKAGEQTLSGGQALAYARIRKIDSDLVRGNRQRDVLKALFNKVKKTSLTDLPKVASKILSMCHTTLTADEMIELGVWAITNDPEILNFALPETKVYGYSWIWEGNHPNYNWVWIYDLDFASALLIDFIFDKDTAKDMPKPTRPNEPVVTKPTTTPTGGGSTNPTQPDVSDPTGGYIDPTGTGSSNPTDAPTGTDIMDPTGTGSMTDPTGTDVIGTVDPTVSTDPTVTDPTEPTTPVDPTDPTNPTEPATSTTPSFAVGGTTAPTQFGGR